MLSGREGDQWRELRRRKDQQLGKAAGRRTKSGVRTKGKPYVGVGDRPLDEAAKRLTT